MCERKKPKSSPLTRRIPEPTIPAMNDRPLTSTNRWKRRFLFLFGVLAVFGGAFSLLFLSTQHVPEFYEVALNDPELTPETAEQVKKRTQKLLQEIEQVERDSFEWSETITERECNAWLAYEFPRKFPHAEQEGLSDLRVHLERDRILFGCRLESERFSGIVSVALRPQIDPPNQLSVAVLNAQVGQVPLPLQSLFDEAYAEARKEGFVDALQVDWQPSDLPAVEGVLSISSDDSERWEFEILAVHLNDLAVKIVGRIKTEEESVESDQPQESESSLSVN